MNEATCVETVPMTFTYEAHSWHYVLSSFRDLAGVNPYFAPMAAFVDRLAGSAYAAGLFPVMSMHTIRLYQQQHYSMHDDEIRVDFDSGEFIVRYRSGGSAPGVWTKRSADGFAALERCLHHLGWFVEYNGHGGRTRPGDD
jgi:hypothetical protein